MTIYQEELKRMLREAGYGTVYDEDNAMLKIYRRGDFLCEQDKKGKLTYTEDKNIAYDYAPQIQAVKDEAKSVRFICGLYEKGEAMKVESVSNYHKFVEFGNTVLAGTYNKGKGFHFVSWWQNEEGTYLSDGHYTGSYEKAKEEFAVRAGLVNANKIFTEKQAEVIFKSVNYARDECEDITYEQDEEMDGIMERLIYGYPEKNFSVMDTHFGASKTGDIIQNQ